MFNFSFRIFDDDVDLKSMSASDPTKTLEDELPDEEPTVAEVKKYMTINFPGGSRDFQLFPITLFFSKRP